MANLMRIPQSGAIAINDAVDRMNTLTLFVQQSLRESLDYGTIPGCGDKPVLFKPGAEKIATLFGLRINIERTDVVKDFTGKDFGGEPFFYFEYLCILKDRHGDVVAQCSGSCNSWEDKYRWRKSERCCPQCGQPTILKSKQDGSWFCWTKKGGCGAKYPKGDAAIESQKVGRVPNERIFDQVNTIDKMSQKRAVVGAVILAANASNYFAVEQTMAEGVEIIDADYEPAQPISKAQPMERIQVEVMPDNGNDNQARIAQVINATEHSWAEAKEICDLKVRPVPSSELSSVELRELIRWLLADYAVKRRYIQQDTAYGLTTELIKQQPSITDESLVNRYFVRLDELAESAPVSAKAPGRQFKGVSIE